MRIAMLLVAACLAGGVATTLDAQRAPKTRRVTTGPDADGDGVADADDRCPNTPAGRRVGPDGCAIRLLLPGQQAPQAGAPASGQAAGTPQPINGTGAARQNGVTQQSTVHPGAPVAGNSAGLSIASYTGRTDAERDAYVRRFATMLDSTVVTLIEVFRNTSGQPIAGAESPASLSQRERDRWSRCRDIHFDLQSYGPAFHDFVGNLPAGASVEHAAEALDSALTALQATAECDNVASMIVAPGRWTPWGQQYDATARRFYRDWYNQIREVDDRNRAFVVAFNTTRPAGARLPVPPAIPRTPPYVGVAPR